MSSCLLCKCANPKPTFLTATACLQGYLWQLVNCLFTAGYSLYLRGTMDRVVALTVNKTKLDEFSMVFYNNLLSLPLIGGLMWWCALASES